LLYVIAIGHGLAIFIDAPSNPTKTQKPNMHPAPENCNPPELFLYVAVRSALKFEVQTEGRMVINKNAKASAITLLNAYRGTNLKPRAKASEVYALFCEHFGPFLP
jgi:hypothetical protein